MPFFLLLLIAAACFPERWPQPLGWLGQPQGSPVWFAGLTWGGVLALLGACRWIVWRTCRDVRNNAGSIGSILRRFAARRRVLQSIQSIYLLFAVYVLGWGWTVQTVFATENTGLLPGAELLIAAPFLVPLILSWAIYYDAEALLFEPREERESSEAPFVGRWSFVLFHARQSLALLVAPLALLVVDKGLRRAFPGPNYEQYIQIISLAMLVAVFVGLPWILRLSLGLTPLPDGPIRMQLMECARRLRFRCSDILVWNTNGAVGNAVVAGLVPQLRYVVFTDRLLNELAPEEIEAVFGHEIGHVKHHHMFYYIGFLILSLCTLAGMWVAARRFYFEVAQPQTPAVLLLAGAAVEDASLQDRPDTASITDREVIPLVGVIGAYVFVVFGFLSRRCERQADVYGCRAVSCQRADCADHEFDVALAPRGYGLCPTGIRTFIDALEKVACMNGINRNKPGWLQSWQHSTIARRVEFLQRVLADPREEVYFQRRVALVKWGLLFALVGALGTLIATLGWNQLGLI